MPGGWQSRESLLTDRREAKNGAMGSPQSSPEETAIATNVFVRHRNALLTRVKLTALYTTYYLQMADAGRTVDSTQDELFKRMFAAFVLHSCSRPRNEMVAWTINLQEPLLNLFATSDNEAGTAVGRVFTTNVKPGAANLFYVETVRGRDPARRSVVEFSGSDMFVAAEKFYEDSEQRPGRFFDLGNDDFALLAAHPDCDVLWLRGVETAELRTLAETEVLVPLEQRACRWICGCNEKRIFKVLEGAMRDDPDALFQGDEVLAIECPRCGIPYHITREAMEAHLARAGK